MKINFREASTKRGIVMTVTGVIVLYQMLFGHGVANIDTLLARVDWWLGIGLTIVGMLGFLPDEPARTGKERTRETDLPAIELQARSESTANPISDSASQSVSTNPDLSVAGSEPVVRVRTARMPPHDFTQSHEQSVRSGQDGYNG